MALSKPCWIFAKGLSFERYEPCAFRVEVVRHSSFLRLPFFNTSPKYKFWSVHKRNKKARPLANQEDEHHKPVLPPQFICASRHRPFRVFLLRLVNGRKTVLAYFLHFGKKLGCVFTTVCQTFSPTKPSLKATFLLLFTVTVFFQITTIIPINNTYVNPVF